MSPSLNPNEIMGGLMLAAISFSPVAFPKVTIDGDPFELRYTLRSTFFLETSGQLGSENITKWLSGQYEHNRSTSAVMIIIGSMLGREISGKWKPMPITGCELSEKISIEEWAAISKSYAEALGKVTEGLKAALESLKKPETEPTPETTAPIVN